MANSRQEIIGDVLAHICKDGGPYRSWYVGISRDARVRLFSGHRVKEKGDWWIYRQACSAGVAREIERYFVETLGADGGSGGGDETADTVYAYRKAPHTRP